MRIPILLEIPAAVKGVSVEPMLEYVDLSPYLPGLDWVICGGESGPKARPMNLDWTYDLMRQCREHSTAFFLKQTGTVLAKQFGYKHKKGGESVEWPESLRVQQYPHEVVYDKLD